MTSKLTREWLQHQISAIEAVGITDSNTLLAFKLALAAMDSESECLPPDYLQGLKDGLEWAAQLAEADHPETGDWLYDDPFELAKAIRKGPDMPPVQPAPVVLDDLLSMAASAIEDLLEHTDPNTSYYSGVWADVPGKLRAAAMLQTGSDEIGSWSNSKNTPTSHSTAPAYPETLPCPVLLEPGMRFSKGIKTSLVLKALQRRADHYADLEAMSPEERAEYDANIEAFKAMLQPGNSPVIPGCDGAELLPSTGQVIELNPDNNKLYTPLSTGFPITKEMIIAGQEELEACIDNGFDSDADGNRHDYTAIASDAPYRVFCAMLAAAPQDAQDDINALIPLVSRDEREVK